MKSEKNSNKLVLYNTLSTVILYAITFFSAPLFSRLLGKNEYGVVQVYNTWVSFFVVILGLYTRGTLSIAKINLDETEFIEYQSSILFLSLISFVAGLIFIIITSPIVVTFLGLGAGYLILMLFHSFGVYCVYFINTIFTYEMKARNNLMISVALALANFGLSYLLIEFLPVEHLYTRRIIGLSLPYIIAEVLIMFYIFQRGKTFFNRKYWKFCLPLCLPLIFHGISGIICASSDRVMIQHMIGWTAVGIYALAYNFANIMDSIWGALHNSWDPFFFEYVKYEQYSELAKRSKNYIRLYTCLSMGFILLTPEVFHIFAGSEYWEGMEIVPIIVLSQYAIFIYAFAANYEFAFKRTDIVAIGSTVAGIVNIILNFVLINLLGYFGAAIATLMSNIVLAILHIIFTRKLVGKKWIYSIKMFLLPLIGMFTATVLFYCHDIGWIVRWLFAIAVGLYMLLKIYRNRAIF